MSLMIALDVLKGLIPTAASQTDANEAFREEAQWSWQPSAANVAATPIPEHVMWVARRKMRVIGIRFSTDTAYVGVPTNFFSIVVAVRHASAPATQKIIATYNADTAGTKDLAQFATRDFYASGDINAAAADADFILLVGDVVTVTITKTGTGQVFNSGDLEVVMEQRD
jgi:hypothetical protein